MLLSLMIKKNIDSKFNKDELIDAQKQVIGILFEIIKRLQSNLGISV